MSRLRRIALSDRFFFITCRIFRDHRPFSEHQFACLADVIQSRRTELRFALTAWAFLPNHWHAILFAPHPLTISTVLKSIKVSSATRINEMNHEHGSVWQGRFFDRALRTVKEYRETVEYIHWNPVKAGLAKRPEDWTWSSARELSQVEGGPRGTLSIDRVELPVDETARL